jgi:hypothetical protein
MYILTRDYSMCQFLTASHRKLTNREGLACYHGFPESHTSVHIAYGHARLCYSLLYHRPPQSGPN